MINPYLLPLAKGKEKNRRGLRGILNPSQSPFMKGRSLMEGEVNL